MSGYLMKYPQDMRSISLDLQHPSTYLYISFYLSIDLLLLLIHHILWYPSTSSLISNIISFYYIHWYPATYPETPCHLSCWIFDLCPVSAGPAGVQRLQRFTQASAYIFPRLHWQVLAAGLLRPGDRADGQVGGKNNDMDKWMYPGKNLTFFGRQVKPGPRPPTLRIKKNCIE